MAFQVFLPGFPQQNLVPINDSLRRYSKRENKSYAASLIWREMGEEMLGGRSRNYINK